ncbi:hypothetical protein E4T42_04763 [Aureobasidium subglaciale]|nr:hypothetical protein E4T42_04763 [Aureobasidium subglaciale]
MRRTNKEPQWTTVYDDLFNQYIDTDGFEFGTCNAVAATSSSDEASNSEVINSIEANFTESGDSSSSEAAARRFSDDFWARTLAVLGESASTLEDEQDGSRQRESQQQQIHALSPAISFYNTKNHPHADFLSLGGFPSPHISNSPSSPSAEAAARRRKATRYQQDRRITKTPERPVGIKKVYRSSSKSPNMMSPSRYRAGAQDAWIGSVYQTPNRMTSMNLPVRSMPLTPPSSGRSKPSTLGLGFQGLGDLDASPFQPFTNYDEQTSPFSQTFNQESLPKQLYSPEASPLTSPSVERGAMFAEEPTIFRDVYYKQPIATAATVGSYNESAWSANSFGVEDIYEPSPTFSPWMASEKKQAEYQASLTHDYQVHNSLLQATYNDPTLAPAFGEEIFGGLDMQEQTPYHTTTSYPIPLHRESRTPSPPRVTKRKSSSKLHTHSRRSSKSERKPSRGNKAGGFVNYTPSDSEKLLTGVAPSGSSKTKARREREQADRWRRFSQAAAKAVAEAGGVVGDVAPVANMLPSSQEVLDARAGDDWS